MVRYDVKATGMDELILQPPQVCLIGSKSNPTSPLVEALAGEAGLKEWITDCTEYRPVVLKFVNAPHLKQSKWHVWNKKTRAYDVWNKYDVIKGLPQDYSPEQIDVLPDDDPFFEEMCVMIESPSCIDVNLVALPGFQLPSDTPHGMTKSLRANFIMKKYMQKPESILLCVEEATSDPANMLLLFKCRAIDPALKRTMLVRNNLDKHYMNLRPDNVNQWADGMPMNESDDGDAFPQALETVALSLANWNDKENQSLSLVALRDKASERDLVTLGNIGMHASKLQYIGFNNLVKRMEHKVQDMVLNKLGKCLEWTSIHKSFVKMRQEKADTEAAVSALKQEKADAEAVIFALKQEKEDLMLENTDLKEKLASHQEGSSCFTAALFGLIAAFQPGCTLRK